MPVIKPATLRLPRKSPLIVFAALVLALCTAIQCQGQTYTPYGYFAALTVGDVGRVQAKITYMGIQNVPLATIVFAVPGNPTNPSLFVPFRRPGFSYSNDRFATKSFSVSAAEMKATIDSVAKVTEVSGGAAETLGFVSFALMDTLGSDAKVFESIIGTHSARKLFGTLLQALKGNAVATARLRRFGCSEDILPNDPPTSADESVSVRFSGVRADRKAKGQFVGRVRVMNTSGATIPAPVTLLVLVSGTGEMLGPDGHSCRTNLYGHAYVILAPAVDLAPGATIERVLRFTNPSLGKFNVNFHVFSGPGTM